MEDKQLEHLNDFMLKYMIRSGKHVEVKLPSFNEVFLFELDGCTHFVLATLALRTEKFDLKYLTNLIKNSSKIYTYEKDFIKYCEHRKVLFIRYLSLSEEYIQDRIDDQKSKTIKTRNTHLLQNFGF
jgi:hypothetical protein